MLTRRVASDICGETHMKTVVAPFCILGCILLLGGFNALQGPAATVVALIAGLMLVVALFGGRFMRSRSAPQ